MCDLRLLSPLFHRGPSPTAGNRLLQPPPTTPRIGARREPYYGQQKDRADRRDDNRRHDSTGDTNTQLGHQPAADQGSDDPDGYIADQAESAALDNFSGEPAGNKTHQQNHEKTFAR